jgi:hypothetical protein
MIYRELKVYETPLGLRKTARIDMCERIICGHIIYKIDLIPAVFGHVFTLLGIPGLEINYPLIRGNIVTVLGGDCSDEQYTAALIRIYEESPFFEAYINYHYIMRRNGIDIKDLVIPLVDCVKNAGKTVLQAAKGTYMAEDSGYMYILDAYAPALHKQQYVEIR